MNVLFLAYYFPPDSSSGSFRPLFFANHLATAGVGVHVLTVKVEDYLAEQSLDHKLSDKLHRGVEISRCSVWRPREALIALRNRLKGKMGGSPHNTATFPSPAGTSTASRWQTLKDSFTDLLVTPDPHVGWLPDCVKRGKVIIAENRPDIIYATASPWSGLLAGMLLKKTTGVPLVLDFRDPWTSNPSFKRRGRFFQAIDCRLEKLVVNAADGIIANTPTLRDDFLSKFPEVRENQVITITNGFEEYLPLAKQPPDQPLTITHTGALYFSRNPAPLLEAVKQLIENGQIASDEIRLNFIGGIEVKDETLAELLTHETLRQVISVAPRVSYDESQHYAREADLLLLVQPDFPLQIPRKLYEYMAVRKPMFCIAEPASATGRLVRDNRLGAVCNNTVHEIESSLRELICAWRNGNLKSFTDDRCDKFRNRELTSHLHDFMVGVCDRQSAGRP